MACMDIDMSSVPDVYYCELCIPRPVNPERAKALQQQFLEQREQSSDSESEYVTNSTGKGEKEFRELEHTVYNAASAELTAVLLNTSGLQELASLSADPPTLFTHDVNPNRKGLFNDTPLVPGQFVIEYLGRAVLRADLTSATSSYVFYYPKDDVVIDARASGNIARFVRRSCTPNLEFREVLSHGLRSVAFFATAAVPSGTELTIPFEYPVERARGCACKRPDCSVKSVISARRASRKSRDQNGLSGYLGVEQKPAKPAKSSQPAQKVCLEIVLAVCLYCTVCLSVNSIGSPSATYSWRVLIC